MPEKDDNKKDAKKKSSKYVYKTYRQLAKEKQLKEDKELEEEEELKQLGVFRHFGKNFMESPFIDGMKELEFPLDVACFVLGLIGALLETGIDKIAGNKYFEKTGNIIKKCKDDLKVQKPECLSKEAEQAIDNMAENTKSDPLIDKIKNFESVKFKEKDGKLLTLEEAGNNPKFTTWFKNKVGMEFDDYVKGLKEKTAEQEKLAQEQKEKESKEIKNNEPQVAETENNNGSNDSDTNKSEKTKTKKEKAKDSEELAQERKDTFMALLRVNHEKASPKEIDERFNLVKEQYDKFDFNAPNVDQRFTGLVDLSEGKYKVKELLTKTNPDLGESDINNVVDQLNTKDDLDMFLSTQSEEIEQESKVQEEKIESKEAEIKEEKNDSKEVETKEEKNESKINDVKEEKIESKTTEVQEEKIESKPSDMNLESLDNQNPDFSDSKLDQNFHDGKFNNESKENVQNSNDTITDLENDNELEKRDVIEEFNSEDIIDSKDVKTEENIDELFDPLNASFIEEKSEEQIDAEENELISSIINKDDEIDTSNNSSNQENKEEKDKNEIEKDESIISNNDSNPNTQESSDSKEKKEEPKTNEYGSLKDFFNDKVNEGKTKNDTPIGSLASSEKQEKDDKEEKDKDKQALGVFRHFATNFAKSPMIEACQELEFPLNLFCFVLGLVGSILQTGIDKLVGNKYFPKGADNIAKENKEALNGKVKDEKEFDNALESVTKDKDGNEIDNVEDFVKNLLTMQVKGKDGRTFDLDSIMKDKKFMTEFKNLTGQDFKELTEKIQKDMKDHEKGLDKEEVKDEKKLDEKKPEEKNNDNKNLEETKDKKEEKKNTKEKDNNNTKETLEESNDKVIDDNQKGTREHITIPDDKVNDFNPIASPEEVQNSLDMNKNKEKELDEEKRLNEGKENNLLETPSINDTSMDIIK